MCNLHTLACNKSLTLKLGTIQIRQLLRLYPDSWLEAGFIHIPELRINAKFECHPPTPATVHEQLEFLRRHVQHSQRLHFLYQSKSQVLLTVQPANASNNFKRPSNAGLAGTSSLSCAYLHGSAAYYTLVQGEQFFKSTFRLSEWSSFGRSLFRPDQSVIRSHPIFEQKYAWNTYEHGRGLTEETLNDEDEDEDIFYPFDFCAQPKQTNEQQRAEFHETHLRHSVPASLSTLSRSNSTRNVKQRSATEQYEHKRFSSSIPLHQHVPSTSSSSTAVSDIYLTPNEQHSLTNSSPSSLDSTLLQSNHLVESSSISWLTMIKHPSSTISSPFHSRVRICTPNQRTINRMLWPTHHAPRRPILWMLSKRFSNSTRIIKDRHLCLRRVFRLRWTTLPFLPHRSRVPRGLVCAIRWRCLFRSLLFSARLTFASSRITIRGPGRTPFPLLPLCSKSRWTIIPFLISTVSPKDSPVRFSRTLLSPRSHSSVLSPDRRSHWFPPRRVPLPPPWRVRRARRMPFNRVYPSPRRPRQSVLRQALSLSAKCAFASSVHFKSFSPRWCSSVRRRTLRNRKSSISFFETGQYRCRSSSSTGNAFESIPWWSNEMRRVDFLSLGYLHRSLHLFFLNSLNGCARIDQSAPFYSSIYLIGLRFICGWLFFGANVSSYRCRKISDIVPFPRGYRYPCQFWISQTLTDRKEGGRFLQESAPSR